MKLTKYSFVDTPTAGWLGTVIIQLTSAEAELGKSESEEGLGSCLGTVAATGQHSGSCRCRIQTVFSLDYKANKNMLHKGLGFGMPP